VDGQGTKSRRNIAANFKCLSRVHERYRQTDEQTGDSEFTFAKKCAVCSPREKAFLR